jgi:hypothetical protein
MIMEEPICIRCKHYNIETSSCSAFPDEIPDEIIMGDNDHCKPLPDQENKVVFEPKEKN